ncbi:hypothetical protein H6P81_017256 [Aristolochia fimbriata]|uniref:Protein kinase domain-containing protein n=1 Tax=Aristolochia fimbriata TaxID=158543 RepID=A0AAV7E1Z0_ARIFI|nr:hypothetical protein H6P81_017256 [Aristolochia fimbriata]
MSAVPMVLSSSEIYQGCRTSSEHSFCSPSSSEPFLSPSPSARELYEGLITPDWLDQTETEIVVGEDFRERPTLNVKKAIYEDGSKHVVPRIFRFRELAAATDNFSIRCVIREEEYGKVYKGRLKSTNQVVAIKLFNNGPESERAFSDEMRMLTYSLHQNVTGFIGYCAKNKKKLVVNKYIPSGLLEDHLHGLTSDKEHLLEHEDENSSYCCCKAFGIFK